MGAVTGARIQEHVSRLQDRADVLDPQLGIFTSRFGESARRRAAELDAVSTETTRRSPIVGKVIGVKDILATIEGPTTAQSRVPPAGLRPGEDAEAVARLRVAGAVIAGKTTTMEYALGLPDRDAPYPISRNPWDHGRWAGGSSTGSAIGVAVDVLDAAIGTDTMGSIRVPAACCGVTGFKPTFRSVPTGGCIPVSPSLDHIGPIARSVAECWELLRRISDPVGAGPAVGPDRLDGMSIGVVEGAIPPGEDPDLSDRFDAVLREFEALGASLRTVTLDGYDEAGACATVISSAEATALHHPHLADRWSDYGRSLRLNFALGTLTAAADYVEAQRVRSALRRSAQALLDSVDAVIMPTMSVAPPRCEPDGTVDLGPVLAHIHTRYWDLTGQPAIAMPMGLDREGLPLSVQLVGRHGADGFLAGLGIRLQERTDFHELRPPDTGAIGRRSAAAPPPPSPPDVEAPLIRDRLLSYGITADDQELNAIAGAHRSLRRAAASWRAGPLDGKGTI